MANIFDDLPPHAYDPNAEADDHLNDSPLPFDDEVPYAPYESPARNNVLNEPVDFDPEADVEPEAEQPQEPEDTGDIQQGVIFELRLRALQFAREAKNDAGLPLDADDLVDAAKKIENYLYS